MAPPQRGHRGVAVLAVPAFLALAALLACDDPATEAAAFLPVPPRRAAAVQLAFTAVPIPGLSWSAADVPATDPAEALGRGVCLLDADDDGRLDVFLPTGTASSATTDQRPGRLLRNTASWTFEDVTDVALPLTAVTGRGCAVADVDGDGDDDLYITALGPNLLLLNDGRGHFRDASGGSGVADPRWSTGAAFADFDTDGHVDLVVANYLDRDPAVPPSRRPRWHRTGFAGRIPGGHQGAPAAADALFRGRGDGTFEDVTEASGILLEHAGQGLGVVVLDADGDSDPDVFVVNDSEPDSLFVNDGTGHFTEGGLLAGVALAEDGRALSGAAAVAGDIDGDLALDLLVTGGVGESTTPYLGDGQGSFRDATTKSGLVQVTAGAPAWGACLLDADEDGRRDLLIARGDLQLPRTGIPAVPGLQLLRQVAAGRFEDVSSRAGSVFAPMHPARGLVCGDLDGDGDLDAVVTRLGAAPLLVRNDTTGAGGGIAFALEGARSSGPDALGARVTLEVDGGRQAVAFVGQNGGWSGGGERLVRFGLGQADGVTGVEVRWPSGRVDLLGPLKGGATWRLREGSRHAKRLPRTDRGSAPSDGTGATDVVAAAVAAPARSPSLDEVAAWVTVPEGLVAADVSAEALRYLQAGRVQEAMGWAASAARQDGNGRDAWRVLALAASRTRDVALAGFAFRRALELDSASLDLRLGLGELLLNARKLDEAREVLAGAVLVAPDDAAANWLLGVTLADLGLTADAVAALERAASVAQRKAAVLHRLGLVLQSSGQLDRAEDAFTRSLADEPTLHGARYGLLLVAARRGGAAPAEAEVERVLADSRLAAPLARALARAVASPADATRRLDAGLLLEQAGRLAEAMVEYEAAGLNLPPQVDAAVSYARVCRRQGRYGRALEALTAAELEFGPSPAVALESARLQAGLGNTALAVSLLEATAAPGARTLEVEEELARVLLASGGDAARTAILAVNRAGALGSRDVVLRVQALVAADERGEAELVVAENLAWQDGATRRALRESLAVRP